MFNEQAEAMARDIGERFGRRAAERFVFELVRDDTQSAMADLRAHYGNEETADTGQLFDFLGAYGARYSNRFAVKLASEVCGEEWAQWAVDELRGCTEGQRRVLAQVLNDDTAFDAAPVELTTHLTALRDADPRSALALWIVMYASLPMPCRPKGEGVEGVTVRPAPSGESYFAELAAQAVGVHEVDFTSEEYVARVGADDESDKED